MFFATAQVDKLTNRLDADFYNPEYLVLDEKIDKFQTISIGSISGDPKSVTYGVLKPRQDESKFLLARIQNFEDGFLNLDSCIGIEEEQFTQYARSECVSGDIIVALGGYPGKACIISNVESGLRININQHIARVRVSNSSIDAYYLLGYFMSNVGRLSLKRQISGSVQAGINLEDLRNLHIVNLMTGAQKYIGEKVRQAERLRAWAKSIKQTLQEFENDIPVKKHPRTNKKYAISRTLDLTENRLDAEFYEDKHIDLNRQFNNEFSSLGALTTGFKYGSSVKADYVGKGKGIPFVRGNALTDNEISSSDIVYLDRSLTDELKNNFLNIGDVMITRSGTVGVACDVYEGFDKYAYGSFIINSKPKSEVINPLYLSWYLNSWVGQQQFRRWENGAVQLNINTEELASIEIWIAPNEFQLKVAEQIKLLRAVNRLAQCLIASAKLFVEDLIEGQLTESQLVSAQQALEAGDDSLDRALLERMTAEGVDAESDPLFDDIDQLYDLLEQAKQALDADDTMAGA